MTSKAPFALLRARHFVTLSTLLTVLSGPVMASQPIIAQPDSACAKSSDSNEAPFRFTAVSQKYAGQCMNTNKFRIIRNLKIENNQASLNNFQHENTFWKAEFSLAADNIEAVYLQILRFPVLGVVEAGHAQLRFKLKSPVRLQSQSGVVQVAPVSDVTVSFEATFPEGVSYNFALGAIDNYGLLARVISPQQKRLDSPQAPGEQYELSLNAQEKSQLLVKSLNRAVQLEAKYPYNTLRPNCVSEAFDLIDSLERLKGKHAPFLTVISNDPVGQPAINAMMQREILKARVQDYADEERGVIRASVAMPQIREVPYLPRVSDRPWTLVLTLPDLNKLSPSERQAVLRVREMLLAQAPLLLQGAGSAMMLEAGGDTARIISGSLGTMQSRVMQILREVNSSLPNTAQPMGIYVVPYSAALSQTRLDHLPVPFALPFGVVNTVVDDSVPRSNEVYYHIAEGARRAGDAGVQKPESAFFMASAMRLRLQKNNVQVRAQLMLGLNNQTKPFTMSNSQVNFQQSVVNGAQNRATRPVILATHTQIGVDRTNPQIKIEFGGEGGIAGTLAGDAFGIFQINKNLSGSCELQAASAPTLNGELAATALGKPVLDRILQGKKVAFHILGVNLNAQTQTVTEMDVRVRTWPLNCVSSATVNDQFAQNANDMITKLKTEAKDKILPQLLEKFLRR